MKTIPNRLLTDTVKLIWTGNANTWRGNSEKSLTLTRVHVQRSSGMSIGNGTRGAMEVKPTARVWYDFRASSPVGVDLLDIKAMAEKGGDALKCEHAGTVYTVSAIHERRGGVGVHHFEMELI